MFTTLLARWKLRRLARSWIAFRDIVAYPRVKQDVTAREETLFLELQARIAALLPVVTGFVPSPVQQEAQAHARSMLELMNQHRTLRLESPLADKDREEFERRWHDDFLFLSKMKGLRLGAPTLGVQKRPVAAPTGLPDRRVRQGGGVGRLVRVVFQLAALALIVYVVVWALGMGWDDSGKFGAGRPRSVEELGRTVTRSIESLSNGAERFMAPVVGAYGLEATLILVGILLLAGGYWTLVRTR